MSRGAAQRMSSHVSRLVDFWSQRIMDVDRRYVEPTDPTLLSALRASPGRWSPTDPALPDGATDCRPSGPEPLAILIVAKRQHALAWGARYQRDATHNLNVDEALVRRHIRSG